jgi:hypothetical protein
MRRKLGIGAGHVTLTDEGGLIVAVAVLETAPRKKSRTPVRAKSRTPARKRKSPRQ